MAHFFLQGLQKFKSRTWRLLISVFFVSIFSALNSSVPSPNCTVQIPMRDGTLLPTDIYYHPKEDPSKLPCLLLRNPAGRKAETWFGLLHLVEHGYVLAFQDARNAIDVEGKTPPYLSDGWGKLQDGYDTVEWLAKSPYSNGKIGTLGFSACGITQFMMAPSAPPSLVCQYIGQAASSLYHHGIFPGGQLRKHQVEAWLGMYAPDSGVISFIIGQPFYSDFWKKVDSTSVAEKATVPALHYVGWYDTFVQGTIDGFVAKQKNGGEGAKGQQKLIIGPWTHFWPFVKTLGDFNIPAGGEHPPCDMSPKTWFDHYLKGIPNEASELSAITYFVMGPLDGTPSSGNIWKSASHWPIPSQDTAFFLTPEKGLSEKTVKGKEALFAYKYDPRHPVPTIGGRNLFLDQGPKDQRPIENRPDTVVFTSELLTEDLEVTGQVRAKLWFSSDKQDTDVVVRLTDVYPDGKSVLIADGICRTGMLNALRSHSPKEAQELEIDLWSISQVFAKGHQIRVAITSSNYPRYEKNHNVGLIGNNRGKSEIAHNVIHTGEKTPSRLILPVVNRGEHENHYSSSGEREQTRGS